MTTIHLSIFIISAFLLLVYLLVTDKTTKEEQNEMLDSEEMFP